MEDDTYSLGSSEKERQRLLRQREVYGDTIGLNFSVGETVCEFGCGSGANLWIAREIDPGRYVGIDRQPSMIENATGIAKRKGLSNVDLRVGQCEESGLADKEVDVAFCRCVLIHQPDPRPILKEMLRVTKHGGKIVVIEPCDSTYYVGPEKESLLRCFRARNEFAYGGGRGSPEVAFNLYPLMLELGLEEVSVVPHVISVTGKEAERCEQLLSNLLGLIEPVAEDLIEASLVTAEDLQRARAESATVNTNDFLTQTLWIAEGRVGKKG